MVLLKLSRQLAELQPELQIHWILGQNEESDDLSKGKFDAFSPTIASLWTWLQLIESHPSVDGTCHGFRQRSATEEDFQRRLETNPTKQLSLEQPW